MNLKQKLYDLQNRKKTLLDEAKAILLKDGLTDAYKAKYDEAISLDAEIEAVKALISQEEAPGMPQPNLRGAMSQGGGTPENTMEKSIKSLASAARSGFKVKAAGDMMQEGVGADGGYTVPQDIVTRIIELREAEGSLLTEVTREKVSTNSGTRTIKKRSQRTGFATVAEAAKFPKLATPQFVTLQYTIEKRGGYLPVTAELLADSDNNISDFIMRWFAAESSVTAHRLILQKLQTKEASDLGNLDGIVKAWLGLGSAFRSSSKVYTNDDGLGWLATLKDANGRWLLSPNPSEPGVWRLAAGPAILPIVPYANDQLPTSGTKLPFILGDLKSAVVYWDRQILELRGFDQATFGALNAAEQDLIIFRGSQRDDCSILDDAAYVNGYVDTAAIAS